MILEPFTASPLDVALAFLAATTIALAAYRKRLLDHSGAVAASLLGPGIVATGGWWLGALLVAFFASSSLLPKTDAKRPSRDGWQVLANGGPALMLSGLGIAAWREELLVGAAAAIAAATADTWATELGRRFGGRPWSIHTWRRVPPGTSGAVSIAGTLASAVGAVFVAAVGIALASIAPAGGIAAAPAAACIAVGGTLGSVVDSLLGAHVQARFRCEVCGRITEEAGAHADGHPVIHTTGVIWMTNSTVNLTATLASGLAAALLYVVLT